jgi:lysyl endopeptidase
MELLNPTRLSQPRRGRSLTFSLGLLTLLVAFAQCISAQQLSGVWSPVQKKDKAQPELSAKARAARGQAPLNRLYEHIKVSPSKVRRLPLLTPREVTPDASTEKRLRIGEVRAFQKPVKVSSDSTLYSVAEGEVRVMGIVSEGARYTRVHFTDMMLPAGARVFVYSLENAEEFYGPYEGRGPSGDGTFWTPPIEGEAVAIEYFTAQGTGDSAAAPFQISEVSHVYRDPLTKAGVEDAAGACNLEVTSEWAAVAKSVGELQFTSGGSEYLCTGTLLNNQANNFTPYLLTANHCFNTQVEAQTLRVYWNYNSGGVPPVGTPYTDGSTLLATGAGSDFTFVVLTGSLPGGLYFSGWDANPISAETPVAGIHHPRGSHKRISFGTTNNFCPGNILPGPCSSYAGVTWNSGTTEPGSSGSGIWQGTASNPQLIGTLTGGESSCQTPTFIDYYGRFSNTYPSIAPFLTTATGTSCVSALSATSQNFPNTGGTASLTVTAPSGCNWTAVASHSFVTITSGASGNGNGTITFSVASSSTYRAALIVVGTQVFTITQAGLGNYCGSNPISLGETKTGTLIRSDCQRSDGSYSDRYYFQGTAGHQVSISMAGSFNTYLILMSPGGAILATDNDGGGGTNSRIPAGSGMIMLPSSGTYSILATSSTPYVNGSYSVTLNGTTVPAVIPRASISDASFAEGHRDTTFARFNISLSEPSVKSVCVQVTTANGTASAASDYYSVGDPGSSSINSPTAVIFFHPGTSSMPFTVEIRGDTVIEPDETFLVNMTACNADVTIGRGQAVGTILNDDFLPMKLVMDEAGPEPNQAAAIDSLLFLRDLFPIVNTANLLNQGADKNTRVIIFVTNLQLTSAETFSSVVVNLTNGSQSYDLPAEDVRIVPGFSFTQVVFRLPDNLAPGTATIKVKAHGQESNTGTIRIKS